VARRRKAEGIIAGAFRVRRDAKLLAQRAAEERETKRILAEERDARQAQAQAEREAAAKVERDKRERAKAQERAEKQKAALAAKALEEDRKRYQQVTRDLDKRTEASAKQREKDAADRRRAEGVRKTDQLHAEVAALGRIVADRPRGLKQRRPALVDVFSSGGANGFATRAAEVLAATSHTRGFPRNYEAGYAAEARTLHVKIELPGPEVVPAEASYVVSRQRRTVEPIARKKADSDAIYRQVVASVAVRILASVFDATPPELVSDVVLSGFAMTVDRSTGRPMQAWLVSVHAEREQVEGLGLDAAEFDPAACLTDHIGAKVSRHPYDYEAVMPVADIDLSRFKVVGGMDVVAGLDSRTDLLTMRPWDFEHLVRQLFEAMGVETWNTQSCRDDGFDVLAYFRHEVLSGTCVIQAKRYKDVVSVESVRALAGTMNVKQASKGILVTTAWFGKASRDFADANGRIDLIEGPNLKALLQKYLDLDVLIGLPKVPKGWDRKDVQ
jgi:restriction system protein